MYAHHKLPPCLTGWGASEMLWIASTRGAWCVGQTHSVGIDCIHEYGTHAERQSVWLITCHSELVSGFHLSPLPALAPESFPRTLRHTFPSE